MASSYWCLFLTTLLLYFLPSIAKTSSNPKALVLPVIKDSSTQQYVTRVYQRTPRVPVSLTVDLGGEQLWVDCSQGYVSKSYAHAKCRSATCVLARVGDVCQDCYAGPMPGCNMHTCTTTVSNKFSDHLLGGELAQDVLYIQSTNGSIPGPLVSVPGFVFACGTTTILEGLSHGVTGMAGLGRASIDLTSQVSKTFGLPKKFAICLSSSTRSTGAIFLGDKPYILPPREDVSVYLIYTPLIIRPFSIPGTNFPNDPSPEYFIQMTSIKISGETVPINTTLLYMDRHGFGGTKISTLQPYTTMVTPIYNAFVKAFIKQRPDITRVKPVAPFSVCYDAKNFHDTQVGPDAPFIDFVLHHKDVFWRIYGANSMVRVNKDVMCLGFVDGGMGDTAIVIGGHQIEDNLLQFDRKASRLGFSSTLLLHQTRCSNFNFKHKA